MGKLLYLVFFVLLLSGCSQYIHITQTLPPEIVLNNTPKRIAFINQYDYTAHTGKHRPAIAFQTGVKEFGTYLSAHSRNDSVVTFMFNDTLSQTKISESDTNNLLPIDTVVSLCKLYHSDLLLTLDSLNFDFTYEIEVSDNDNGKKTRTAVYYLRSYYYLTLYDQTGDLLKRTYLFKSMQYATRPVVAWIVPVFEPKNLEKACDEIAKLAHESGNEYIGMFFPSENVVGGEKLFKGKIFAESNSLIMNKRYDEAIKLLKKITTSPDAKVAERAKHNLSVAEELKKNL
jgi:hypothetical protein